MPNNTHLPELNCSSATYFASVFGWSSKLKWIDKLILPSTAISPCEPGFDGCSALEHVIVEGLIPLSWNLKDTKKLDKASITSIINALSSTATGQTLTISKTAINNAFGINIDNESTYPEGSEYYNLRNSKSNWTFNYTT